jgi:hypothetical protein
MKLTKEQWIKRYGGLSQLRAERMTVVPCVDCTDSVCHGWKVVNTSIFALGMEDTLRSHGIRASVVDPGRDEVKVAYVGEDPATVKVFKSDMGLIALVEIVASACLE